MTTGHDLAIALRAAYLALHRRSDARFAPHGVTADQFVLLATLARGGEALTQRVLARRMSSDPSTVRAMLVLLAATERGLASYWRTPGVLRTLRGRDAVSVPPGERVLGLLHFGAPEREPAPRERKSAELYVEFLP